MSSLNNQLGYIHRDISAGNVLLVDMEGSSLKRGVLSDLEYAVKLGNKSPAHDVRIGTPFFMACEVLGHRDLDFDRAQVDLHWKPPPFYYNRLHGLLFIFILINWYSRTAMQTLRASGGFASGA